MLYLSMFLRLHRCFSVEHSAITIFTKQSIFHSIALLFLNFCAVLCQVKLLFNIDKMKEKHTCTIDKLPVDRTNWARVANMSDEEIEAAACADEDASPINKKQLAAFKRVHSLNAV